MFEISQLHGADMHVDASQLNCSVKTIHACRNLIS
jgi:hypothetical protein